jgi:TRAP-type C4-dicarboxylate transport system substrate-binding protein
MCYIVATMRMENSIPIRLSSEMRAALEEIAEQTNLNVSDLIRIACDEYIKKLQGSKKMEIPLLIKEDLAEYGYPVRQVRGKKKAAT